MKKNLTFEQAMSRLEEIVSRLDRADDSLEQSLSLFGEGAELVAFCNKSLENAKLQIETMFPQREEVNQ